jgi:hypothetical protein
MVTHEVDCPCNICPGYYVLDNGDSYPQASAPSDVNQAVQLLFFGILLLVSCQR